MKNKFDPVEILFKGILVISVSGTLIYFFIKFIKVIANFFDVIKDIIKDIIVNNDYTGLLAFIISMTFVSLFVYIVINWERRDDFFFFIVRFINSPSNYIYEKRKKELINYRNEVKQLTDYINYFSIITSKEAHKEISQEEILLFIEKVKTQNEFLEKNRKGLEKEINKTNIFIQIFFLLCGVVTTLFFSK